MGDTEHGTWSAAELVMYVESQKTKAYYDWIHANVEDEFGQCAEITERMNKVFPELRRVRGHYYDAIWGEREHWWLVTSDGSVIDPTFKQFPTKGKGAYVPWRDGAPEPTGICMDCGSAVFNKDYFCSKECERSTVAYLKRLLGRI